MYNWQRKDWPAFRFSLDKVEDELLRFYEKAGRNSGVLEALTEEAKKEIFTDIISAEANSLSGTAYSGSEDGRTKENTLAGLVKLINDVRETFREPLTMQQISTWHNMLTGDGKKANGAWRKEGEQLEKISVISIAGRKEKATSFLTPPGIQVEVKAFIGWFNSTAPGGTNEISKAPVRAAIAYLYFETIIPLKGHNEKIAQFISEKAMYQTLGRPLVPGVLGAIPDTGDNYFTSLGKAQRSNEITPWIEYFIKMSLEGQQQIEKLIDLVLKRKTFFDRYEKQLGERQLAAIRFLLKEQGIGNKIEMNASLYMHITQASKATATRDMQQLLDMGAFVFAGPGGGRSTSYQINL